MRTPASCAAPSNALVPRVRKQVRLLEGAVEVLEVGHCASNARRRGDRDRARRLRGRWRSAACGHTARIPKRAAQDARASGPCVLLRSCRALALSKQRSYPCRGQTLRPRAPPAAHSARSRRIAVIAPSAACMGRLCRPVAPSKNWCRGRSYRAPPSPSARSASRAGDSWPPGRCAARFGAPGCAQRRVGRRRVTGRDVHLLEPCRRLGQRLDASRDVEEPFATGEVASTRAQRNGCVPRGRARRQ